MGGSTLKWEKIMNNLSSRMIFMLPLQCHLCRQPSAQVWLRSSNFTHPCRTQKLEGILYDLNLIFFIVYKEFRLTQISLLTVSIFSPHIVYMVFRIDP